MSAIYDQRVAARKDADLMVVELTRVSAILEEVGTVWRRAELFGQDPSGSCPGDLQATAKSLAETVLALPDTDSSQLQAVTFSAVTQLAALDSKAALAAAVTGGRDLGDRGMWAAIQGSLHQAGKQLWCLISCLVKIGELPLTEDATARRDAPAVRGRAPRPQPPAEGSGEALRALAMQRTAIDALPEAELRRLLDLIGGMDPAALQRAAAAYTQMFCAVAGMQASVAALRPVAQAVPGNHLPGS